MTDLSGTALMAELPVDADGRMEDGTDVLAAVAVLQRIGVSTIVLTAEESQDLTDALRLAAPYARVSLGVRCPAVWLLRDLDLPNVELFWCPSRMSAARRLADLVRTPALQPDGHPARTRRRRARARRPRRALYRLDDQHPRTRSRATMSWTSALVELEDEAPAAFKLLIEEERTSSRSRRTSI